MKKLIVRTDDPALRGALDAWFAEYLPYAPEGELTVSDLDSVEALGTEREITVSRIAGKADLCRPFSISELEKAVAHFTEKRRKRLEFVRGKACLDGSELSLSPNEYRLLRLLAEADRPLSQKELASALGNEEHAAGEAVVYISFLRKKTDLPGKERLIFTARGRGYYIKND